jgi:RHS repeat-associated protein
VASGETITYQYDSLNRLIQASGTGGPQGAWSQSFTFDGFGNLTQKTGSNAPSNAFLATNPATNQLTSNGGQYDANGNLTAYGTGAFAAAYAYDIENRMSVAAGAGTVQTLFGYDSGNQRVYQGTYDTSAGVYSNEQIYFYGADGKKLGCWSLTSSGGTYTLTATATNVWFAGRLLTPEDRAQSKGKYFPFGEDRINPNPANPANDQEKFATYTRDSATGLDYAYQRYYDTQLGRFHTPDPYAPSAKPSKPQSWNRYAYAANDPIDNSDPTGLILPSDLWGGDPYTLTGALYPILQMYSFWNGEGWQDVYYLAYTPWNSYNGPTPSASTTSQCNQLAQKVGLAGFNYAEALRIWTDGNLGKVSNGATIAALAAVTWQGESSFGLAPNNYINAPGSVDIGPFQINTKYFYGLVQNKSAVFGTNFGAGKFNGNADANIAEGISILETGYKTNGDNEARLYTGATNPNGSGRQSTYNKYKNSLANLFNNKDCFK